MLDSSSETALLFQKIDELKAAKINFLYFEFFFSLSLPLPIDPPCGLCFQRIVGPVVLGVTTAEFLPNFEIGVLPKTAEVLGELDWLESWGEKLH